MASGLAGVCWTWSSHFVWPLKLQELNLTHYTVFVDPAKPYDSVCRETLWEIFVKKGIPLHLIITLIKNFYIGKAAKISVEGVLSNSIDQSTGLGQGCCVAPTLFNIFLSAVMEDWYTRYQGHMVWGYRLDGILCRHMDARTMGKYTSWDTVTVHDLGYADDAVFIADTVLKLQMLAQDLQSQYLGWGLHMSVGKAEAMATQGGDTVDIPMQTDPEGYDKIKFTQGFKYLGSQISDHGGCEANIQTCIDAARKAFWRLASSVWDVCQILCRIEYGYTVHVSCRSCCMGPKLGRRRLLVGQG